MEDCCVTGAQVVRIVEMIVIGVSVVTVIGIGAWFAKEFLKWTQGQER